MAKMWMVRGDSGRLYDDFRERSIVTLGWSELADIAKPGVSREKLAEAYAQRRPEYKPGAIRSGASQVWRFVNEIQQGDQVLTYSPSLRRYSLGTISSPSTTISSEDSDIGALQRTVQWKCELERDRLSTKTKNSLGSTMTLFLVPESAAKEVASVAFGNVVSPTPIVESVLVAPADSEDEDDEARLLGDLEEQARELIKDRVDKLGWDEMQELVAGVLRALGYKTRVSPKGSDRGADIVASPDGLGFENPRIVVEVKHRGGAMGSKEVRSFLGGRHKDDRGLYVSTGGFTKDARYEADRAGIPLTLWELDDLVRTLLENYEALDNQTRQLVPLRRLYWPA